jgi:hypothetical protein
VFRRFVIFALQGVVTGWGLISRNPLGLQT